MYGLTLLTPLAFFLRLLAKPNFNNGEANAPITSQGVPMSGPRDILHNGPEEFLKVQHDNDFAKFAGPCLPGAARLQV